MGALAPIRPKLLKLIPLLSSDRDGEVLATVRAIERMLRSAGLDWHELADAVGAEPEIIEKIVYRERIVEKIVYRDPRAQQAQHEQDSWEAKLIFCMNRRDRVGSREQEFLDSLERWSSHTTPTEKQLIWLNNIHTRLARQAAVEAAAAAGAFA